MEFAVEQSDKGPQGIDVQVNDKGGGAERKAKYESGGSSRTGRVPTDDIAKPYKQKPRKTRSKGIGREWLKPKPRIQKTINWDTRTCLVCFNKIPEGLGACYNCAKR